MQCACNPHELGRVGMNIHGWQCEIHKVKWQPDAPELAGLGNPPGCPECIREHPGAGRFPMESVQVKAPVVAQEG